MGSEAPRYDVVRGNFIKKEHPLPTINSPILLKTGGLLPDVTPYGLALKKSAPGALEPQTLELLYLNKDKKAGSVNVSQINGLDVVYEGKDVYIEFTYYRPKDNKPEDKKRRVKVESVNYGTQENHLKVGERDDFYIYGDDMQYDRTDNNAKRNFPFWRLGIYGSPESVKNIFQPENQQPTIQ